MIINKQSPLSVVVLLLLLLCCFQLFEANEAGNNQEEYSSALFEPSPLIRVSGPTMFAKPTHIYHDHRITVVVEPSFGKHRKNVDAVFAYAEGYNLQNYRFFIETLQDTGFTGDVVLAIASANLARPRVVEYLKTYSERFEKQQSGKQKLLNVVVYMQELTCLDYDFKRIGHRITRQGDLDAMQLCFLDDVYGYRDPKTGAVLQSVKDVREGRVVATLRYEWYWIWSVQYSSHSWILLLDARDAYFQSNPFQEVPRTTKVPSGSHIQDDGYLYFYGENHQATRLGRSESNRKWISNGYDGETMQALKEKPTICSGSTMGEQIAIETYLRAMVQEWDETDVHIQGSDQGFHNYLYYSSKLSNARTIKAIIVWEQGKGHVNNLGALRTQPLSEWGIFHSKTPQDHGVYQWDNVTLSPVVHQWDRDKELNGYNQRHRMRPLKAWKK